MGRKVVCNNGFRQQRETKLTVSVVYKDVAWKQKAKTGVPMFSKLMLSTPRAVCEWHAPLGSGMLFRKQ